MIQNNINNVRDREAYNMKKIKKFNSIDQIHNTEDLKNLILKPEKIEIEVIKRVLPSGTV